MHNQRARVLIIDDDEDVLTTARMILRPHYDVHTATSPKQIKKILKDLKPSILLLDMNFKTGTTNGNEGLFWLREIRKMAPDVLIIMNTAYGEVSLAVECMKEGATDFLVKPWEKEKLLATVRTVYQLSEAKNKISKLEKTKTVLHRDLAQEIGEIIGESKAIQKVMAIIKKVARTDANVLILGENGTGKELVARAIHQLSSRKDKDFVKADLGSLTESLFESELFGYKKGAFTDAKADRAGRFEIADEGTLFLDEIGNISLSQQAKLLSALQNRQVTPLGSSQSIPIDIRLIAATNKPISKMVVDETFRQDLLYRLNTITLELPPLRERLGDISLLANHFFTLYKKKYQRPDLILADDILTFLEGYSWPGNIRELQHTVERAVIIGEGPVLTSEDFLVPQNKSSSSITRDSLNVEEIEKDAIVRAIRKCQNNLTQAAKKLGLGRSTLYRKMEKYNIRV